jgi:hypothetical protein
MQREIITRTKTIKWLLKSFEKVPLHKLSNLNLTKSKRKMPRTDSLCGKCDANCSEIYGMIAAILTIIAFGILSVLLAKKLIEFHFYSKISEFSFQKTIYYLACLACILRIIRYWEF